MDNISSNKPEFGITKGAFNWLWTIVFSALFTNTIACWLKTQNPNKNFNLFLFELDDVYAAALLGIIFCSILLLIISWMGILYSIHIAPHQKTIDSKVPTLGDLDVKPGSKASKLYKNITIFSAMAIILIGQIHFTNKFIDGKAFDIDTQVQENMYKYISPVTILKKPFIDSDGEHMKYGAEFATAVSYYGIVSVVLALVLQVAAFNYIVTWSKYVFNMKVKTERIIRVLTLFSYIGIIVYFYSGRAESINTIL